MVQDFFNRLTGERGKKDAFRSWPEVQLVQSIPVEEPRQLREFVASTTAERNPKKYGNAIIIGLGSTGRQVVREWLHLVGQDPAGYQETLRAILISQAKAEPLKEDAAAVHQFDLTAGGSIQPGSRQWRSQRELVYLQFRQAANFRPFEEYLNVCLSELKQGMYIFIVASVAEFDIGMLGPVLQAIRLAGEARIGVIPSGVIALLTLGAPRPQQNEGEIYATMREIGRFTFAGTQWMEAPVGLSHGAVHGALLDHALLLEARDSAAHDLDLSQVSFEEGLGRAMGEALFSLTHPSGHPILDQLSKTPAADIRAKSHRPLFHSLVVATLQVPQQDLQAYAAARLARAVIFSENEDRRWEGLAFRPQEPQINGEEDGTLARNWLRSGPCEHPFFNWLLAAEDPGHFRVIPGVVPEYKGAFKAQLANGLTRLLNDPSRVDPLGQARRSLRWLERRFLNLQEWLRQASLRASADPDRRWLMDFLDEALRTIQLLTGEVAAWERILYPAQQKTSGFFTSGSGFGASKAGSWWRSISVEDESEREQESLPTREGETEAGDNLSHLFDHYRQQAEERVEKSAGGQVRRSILAGRGPLEQNGEIGEAVAYYQNTLRPELSRGTQEQGRAFKRVRERLGWWVRLEEPLQLFLVCAPPEISRQDEQSPLHPGMLWRPEQYLELGKQIIRLCQMQARGPADAVGGAWQRSQFVAAADFLTRANIPLLRFNEQEAAVNFFRTMRRSYLIGGDKALTGACKDIVFPNIAGSVVEELDGAEVGRLTAITFEYNVPLNTVLALNKAYSAYGHQESFHIYPQEQIATRYERRIRAFHGWEELPADLTMILVDQQRISVFCQAVFCGLIGVFPDELGHRQDWSIAPLTDKENPFQLAPDSPTGLFDAMQAFALDKPNVHGLESQFGSPFHPIRYADFIQRLWQEARRCRSSAAFVSHRERFEREILAELRDTAGRDVLDRAFANLLQAELEEPLWREW